MPAQPHSLFGTDGVRGLAGSEITPELARRVGRAFAVVLREQADAPAVLLARDTRLSGPELAEAISGALRECGVGVVDCGVIPTGALCMLVGARDATAGVIISASHNPPDSNGIKLVGYDGHKLPLDEQHRLEALVRDGVEPDSAGPAALTRDEGAGDHYLEMVLDGLPADRLSGLHLVLDCAHGSAWELAPKALRRAGAHVDALNSDADGARINVKCGSTAPKAMTGAVVERGADLGVAFDGDADRAVFADRAGSIIDGDGSKYVLAVDLLDRGLLEPPIVVGTVMNNFGLERALTDRGIRLLRTPVGDRHVVATMQETGALVGGEQSGHIIFADAPIGDGIRTALRLCEVVARTGRPLGELAAPVRKIPQLLVNVPVRDRSDWRRSEVVRAEIARWEERLERRGRVLIRASGTEPVVRIMVEAESDELAREAAHTLAVVIRRACSE